MMSRRRLLVALVAVAGLGGCRPAETITPQGSASEVLRVGVGEWDIETAGARLIPGRVQFVVSNVGATRHDVVIEGSEGQWSTPILAPGEQHELTAKVRPGDMLQLRCTVASHHGHGDPAVVPVDGSAT